MRDIKFITATVACLFAGSVFAEPARYASPQDALEALMTGLGAADRSAVVEVFGEGTADYLSAGDPVEDQLNRLALLALYQEGYRFEPQEDGSVMIALGAEDWLFPVPVAKVENGRWSFDNEAGREEVRLREIGRNELEIIALLEAYVDVQRGFRQTDMDGDGVMEFAQQIISSSANERDGLFWAEEDTLFGEFFARASATGFNDGTSDQPPEPFFGYYFRILSEQSDAAPGGAMNYVVNDNMVGGHAMIAVPAVFGETGVHSFMVSENGILLESILGEDTLDVAASMMAYDPTEAWQPVSE